jgi:predicted amidophosphoribosyltransferase
MSIIKCRFCRKSFQGFSALCPACIEQLDSKYIIVRNYLDKNRSANLRQVADDTGVDEKSLLYLIRDGRLSLRGEGGEIICMKCGAPISSGRYCDKCKDNLVHDLENTISAMEEKMKPPQPKPVQIADGKGRLHILSRDD